MSSFLARIFGPPSPRDALTDAQRAAAAAPSEKPIEFDIGRMERALASPHIQLPSGLTPEQKLEFILASVAERK